MKQSDIRIHGVYVLGRGGGQGGVSSTGVRIRILEKNLLGTGWGAKRADHVRVVLLGDDGNELVYAQNEYNDRAGITGTPRTKLVAARFILSLEEIERREAEAREAQEAYERRRQMTEQAKAEIEDKIGSFFNISPVDIHVRVSWDTNLNEPVPQNVRMEDVFAFMAALDGMNGDEEA